MKGKAKLVRGKDGKYHAYYRRFFFLPWRPIIAPSKVGDVQLTYSDFEEFARMTCIDSFDEIILTYDKFSGLGKI